MAKVTSFGARMARKVFESKGGHSEMHLSEADLATMLDGAFGAGRDDVSRHLAQIVLDLVKFQENYQRNVCDYAPGNEHYAGQLLTIVGNEHYAGQLLTIVDKAREAFALGPRKSVQETIDEKLRGPVASRGQ